MAHLRVQRVADHVGAHIVTGRGSGLELTGGRNGLELTSGRDGLGLTGGRDGLGLTRADLSLIRLVRIFIR